MKSRLAPSFPPAISAERLGISAWEAMRLHNVLIDNDQEKYLTSPHMVRPYGCLTRWDLSELSHCADYGFTVFQKKSEAKAVARNAREVLAKLEAAGAEAVDYMPGQLNDLPQHLQNRAFAILLRGSSFDERTLDKRTLEVTQQDLDSYSLKYVWPTVSPILWHIMFSKKLGPGTAGGTAEESRKLEDLNPVKKYRGTTDDTVEELREPAQRLGLRFNQG